MAHFGLWGAILLGAVSATQVAAYSGTRFVVSANLLLPEVKRAANTEPAAAHSMPPAPLAAARASVAVLQPSAATTPAIVDGAQVATPVAKVAEAAVANPAHADAAQPASAPETSGAAGSTGNAALEAGDLANAPRAAQIEPMVAPVKRVQPKAPDIKVRIETGSIDKDGSAASAGADKVKSNGKADAKGVRKVKLVSDKPNCESGFKLDAKGKSCVRVASSTGGKKKRH